MLVCYDSNDLMQSLKCTFCGELQASNSHLKDCKEVSTISNSPSKMSITQLLIKSKQREYKLSTFKSDSFPRHPLVREKSNDAENEERNRRRNDKINARKFFSSQH